MVKSIKPTVFIKKNGEFVNLLLTGATGFIGRNILLRAIAENRYDEIWLLVRKRKKLIENLKEDGFENLPSILRIIETGGPHWNLIELPEHINHLIHCAGCINAKDLAEYKLHNVDSTLELLKRLKSLPDLSIILSSQAASGPCDNGEAKSEESKENPITGYGKSKLEMEQKVREFFPRLKCIFLRPPMVLGPRDNNTRLLFNIAKKPLVFKPGIKPKYYSYISVFDLVSAIFRALEMESVWVDFEQKPFFVCYRDAVTDIEILKKINRLLKKKSPILGVPNSFIYLLSKLIDFFNLDTKIPNLSSDRVKDLLPNRWVVSSEAFTKTFNWKAYDTLDQTIKTTNDWISSQR